MAYFLITCCASRDAMVEEHVTKKEMEDAIANKVKVRAILPDYVIRGKKFDYSYLVKVQLKGE